jgi:hypothetical protein
MFLNKRRSPTLVNVCDFNTLYLRQRNANLNTKNYLSSKSPMPPISSRNLRLVVTNGIPSNILILPKTSSSSQNSLLQQREKKEHKKSQKSTGVDVYRSLPRSVTHCSANSERDITNDDMTSFKNSFTIDRISPLSSTGFFRTNNLPKISKQHTNSNENSKSTQILRTISERIEYLRSTPTEILHRTTPSSQYYEEEKNKMTTPTNVLPCISKDENRKQLHIYMPAINC